MLKVIFSIIQLFSPVVNWKGLIRKEERGYDNKFKTSEREQKFKIWKIKKAELTRPEFF